MPQYSYKCPADDEQFTVSKPIADFARPEKCPSCGKAPATRVFDPPAGIIIAF